MERFNKIQGRIVDVQKRQIYPGEVTITDGIISEIHPTKDQNRWYIMPGFIDAHIHIESSMVTPSEFARAAVLHGTVATLSDPHEIANVLGIPGVQFMMENLPNDYFKIFWGAPSCVPASPFETSGAELNARSVEQLLRDKRIYFLSEMMNFPGVISGDYQVLAKIVAARKARKPIDGHAPGLRGEYLRQYIQAGITTDHETTDIQEAIEKINFGMKIMIREGSAAQNSDSLLELVTRFPSSCMFCSDDRHPDDLLKGHINLIIKKGLQNDFDIFDLLEASSVNPIQHYNIPVGLLQPGDPADFIVVEDLKKLNVQMTVINGQVVMQSGEVLIPERPATPINQFNTNPRTIEEFRIQAQSNRIKVIGIVPSQLYTRKLVMELQPEDSFLFSDVERDILKIAVINRYANTPPALGFVTGLGLKQGAIASSIAHDSHNIIAVGTNDTDLCEVVNLIIKSKGGIALVNGNQRQLLPLPIAGIISNQGVRDTARQYEKLNQTLQGLGVKLPAPFMTLSFLGLTVIPELKLSDRGLFDSLEFQFTSLFD